ncbi:unnamed protein product [Penicillium bialowiezense]
MMNYGGHPFNQQPSQQQQPHQGVQPQHPLGPQPQRQHAQSPLLGAGSALPQHSPFPANKPMFRQQPQQNFTASQSPDLRKMTPTAGSLGGYPAGNNFAQFSSQFGAQSSPDLMSRNPDPMALQNLQRGFNPMAHLRPQPGMGSPAGIHPMNVPSPQQTMNRLPHAGLHQRDHHPSASPSMASPSMFAMNQQRQAQSQSQPQSPQQTQQQQQTHQQLQQQIQQQQQHQYQQRLEQQQLLEQQKQIHQQRLEQQRAEQQRLEQQQQQQKALEKQKLEEKQQQEKQEQQRIEQQKLNQQRAEQQRLEQQQKQQLEQQRLQKLQQQTQAQNPYQQQSPFPQHTQSPFHPSQYQQHQASSQHQYNQHQGQFAQPQSQYQSSPRQTQFQHYQPPGHAGVPASQPAAPAMPTVTQSPVLKVEDLGSAAKKKSKPKKVQAHAQTLLDHQAQPNPQAHMHNPMGLPTVTPTQTNGLPHVPNVTASGGDQATPTPKRRRGRPRKEEVAARLAAQAAHAAANGEPMPGIPQPGQASFTANMTPTGLLPPSSSKITPILGPDGTPLKRKRGRPRKADQIAWAAATGQPLPPPKPRKPSSAKPKQPGTGRPRGRPRKADVAAAAAAAAAAAGGDPTQTNGLNPQVPDGTNPTAGFKRAASAVDDETRKRTCPTPPQMHQGQTLPGQTMQGRPMSVQGMPGQNMPGQTLSQHQNHHMFQAQQQQNKPMQSQPMQQQSSQHLGQPQVQHMHQQQHVSPQPAHLAHSHNQSLSQQAGQQMTMPHMQIHHQSPAHPARSLPHQPYLQSPMQHQMQHQMQTEPNRGMGQQRRPPIPQRTQAPPPPAPQHEHQHQFQIKMQPQST